MQQAKFFIGQVIKHRLFNYRGVIIDVDPQYQGTTDWYEQMAKSRPPKDNPWYHVLVNNSAHETYVAERNLAPDDSGEPIEHPLVAAFFNEFRDGVYSRNRSIN